MERTVIYKTGRQHHRKERILKPKTERTGYLRVHLSSGKSKDFFVHRLVCEAFHENPENKPCVNHIDEDKTNNTASNLEWCTHKENCNHGTRNTRMAKAKSKPVGQYIINGELVKVWQSTMEIERQLGFDNSYIGATAQGKHKLAYGHIWKYIEEDS